MTFDQVDCSLLDRMQNIRRDIDDGLGEALLGNVGLGIARLALSRACVLHLFQVRDPDRRRWLFRGGRTRV